MFKNFGPARILELILEAVDPLLAAIMGSLVHALFAGAPQTFAVSNANAQSGVLAIGWHYFVCDTTVYVARNAAAPVAAWGAAAGSELVPAGERFHFYVANATHRIAAITNGATGRATVV